MEIEDFFKVIFSLLVLSQVCDTDHQKTLQNNDKLQYCSYTLLYQSSLFPFRFHTPQSGLALMGTPLHHRRPPYSPHHIHTPLFSSRPRGFHTLYQLSQQAYARESTHHANYSRLDKHDAGRRCHRNLQSTDTNQSDDHICPYSSTPPRGAGHLLR